VSYVDAVVIAACVRRPIRFVMDHRIFRVPLLSFIFRTMRTIPIASREGRSDDEGPRVRAGGEALRAGEIVGIFPEGKLTETGELNPFRPGVQQMIATTPVPVVPMALSGLWGSFFSRSDNGRAMRRWRGIHSRIALGGGAARAPRAPSRSKACRRRFLALRSEQHEPL
jgi:1-acyl-sn-glycerol-3-phosphate acyltransferase